MTMCKLALSKRAGRAPVVSATEKVGMERGRKEGRKWLLLDLPVIASLQCAVRTPLLFFLRVCPLQ